MRTQTIRFILAVVIGLSRAQPTVATDYAVTDYLPLAVGNSWTYQHNHADHDADYSQWPAYTEHEFPQFTITVERAEVIDGKTYYVMSEMPANWAPPPPHFIAGKTLRWDGTHLMERTDDGEQAIYRFDGHGTSYDIPEVEGDNRVTVEVFPEPVPLYAFYFHGNGEGSRAFGFRAGYGLGRGGWGIAGEDYLAFTNDVRPLRAVLGGTSVEYEDALIPTSSSSSSWGGVKQSWLAYWQRGGSDR